MEKSNFYRFVVINGKTCKKEAMFSTAIEARSYKKKNCDPSAYIRKETYWEGSLIEFSLLK